MMLWNHSVIKVVCCVADLLLGNASVLPHSRHKAAVTDCVHAAHTFSNSHHFSYVLAFGISALIKRSKILFSRHHLLESTLINNNF